VLLYLPIGWWLLTRVLFRVPAELERGGDAVAEERARLGRMGPGERRMALLFLAAALLWVTRADLDLGFARFQGWGDLVVGASGKSAVSDATVAITLALLAFVLPSGTARGEKLLDWSTARALPWDVLLLFGGGFALAGACELTKLDRVLGEGIAPWLMGRPDWLVVLIVVLFVTSLSELASNVATVSVMLPVIGQAAAAAGLSPLLVLLPTTIAASAGFMLPVATPPNAIVFATGEVPATTMARAGLVFDLVLAVLVTAVFVLWGKGVLGIEAGVPAWAAR